MKKIAQQNPACTLNIQFYGRIAIDKTRNAVQPNEAAQPPILEYTAATLLLPGTFWPEMPTGVTYSDVLISVVTPLYKPAALSGAIQRFPPRNLFFCMELVNFGNLLRQLNKMRQVLAFWGYLCARRRLFFGWQGAWGGFHKNLR